MLGSSTNDENANVAMSYRRFRRLLHQKVRELPPAEVKAILTSHITACRSSSCPTCQKLRLHVARARDLAMRMRRWRIFARTIGALLVLHRRLAVLREAGRAVSKKRTRADDIETVQVTENEQSLVVRKLH